jgi:hypothetical protein
MAAQVRSYVYMILLHHPNMMVNMWASCYFSNFNVWVVNYFVTNAMDASLSTFNAGKLFYK